METQKRRRRRGEAGTEPGGREAEKKDRKQTGQSQRKSERLGERAGGRVGWGEKRREGFHRARAAGCQSRSIAHTVPRACPASASPECSLSSLNSAAHAKGSRHAKHKRDGEVGWGLQGRGGSRTGTRAGIAPRVGWTIPGKEKREGGTGRSGQGQPTRPGPPAQGVGAEGMEGSHGTQMGWGRGGVTTQN